MTELSREDYNYLSEFLTLEDFRTHKYSKINELMNEIRITEAGIRKICRVGAEISSIDYEKYQNDVERIDEMKTKVNRFIYLDYQFMDYFRDRC